MWNGATTSVIAQETPLMLADIGRCHLGIKEKAEGLNVPSYACGQEALGINVRA
jgi:hypothetical protein